MLRKVSLVLVLVLALLLAACGPAPTAVVIPTDEPLPTTEPTVKPTEAPKATQVPELQTNTGVQALDDLLAANLPAGCYEYNVKYTAKTDAAGAQLEVFYPIVDFWTLLGMVKAGYTSFYAVAAQVFEADPDLEFTSFIYQKPADSEAAEVGPQPVVIIGVSRENAAKVTADLRWCDLVTAVDRLEMSDEGAASWTDFCK